MKLQWSLDAVEDLDDIFDYIAQDDVGRASEFVGTLRNDAKRLADAPRLGTIIPEIGLDTFREYYTHGYNMIYEIIEDAGVVRIHEVYNPKRIHIRSYFRGKI